jgi:hypothetical protein
MERLANNIELTESEIEKIVFLSFMFGQGDLELQTAFLSSIVSKIGKVDKEKVERAFSDMVDKISPPNKEKATLVTAKAHGDYAEINTKADEQLDSVSELHEGKERSSNRIDYIAENIWLRDRRYLREGRPNRDEYFKPNTLQDPYFSFGVHYIEREMSSGNDHIDAVLEKVRDVPRNNMEARLDVIARYNETHPETPLENF